MKAIKRSHVRWACFHKLGSIYAMERTQADLDATLADGRCPGLGPKWRGNVCDRDNCDKGPCRRRKGKLTFGGE